MKPIDTPNAHLISVQIPAQLPIKTNVHDSESHSVRIYSGNAEKFQILYSLYNQKVRSNFLLFFNPTSSQTSRIAVSLGVFIGFQCPRNGLPKKWNHLGVEA